MDVLLGDVAVDGHRTVVLPVPRGATDPTPQPSAPRVSVLAAASAAPPPADRSGLLRASAVLAASAALTVVTLVAVATLVGRWS